MLMVFHKLTGGPTEIVSMEDLLKIHGCVLDILKEVGVYVPHEEALAIFDDAGADVDRNTKIVRIQADLVENALRTAPPAINLYGVDRDNHVEIGGNRIYAQTGAGMISTRLMDGSYRDATLTDLADFTRLQDALPNIDVMHGLIDPTDIPRSKQDRMFQTVASTIFRNTVKPCCLQIFSSRGVRDLFEMAAVIRGSSEEARKYPLFSVHDTNAQPPLRWVHENGDVIIEAARLGIPAGLTAWGMMGLTAPYSIPAALAQKTATYLSGLVLSQTVSPGTPFLFPVECGQMDMRTGNVVTASPEIIKEMIIGAQLARYYGLPCRAIAATDSKTPDAQAGYEKAAMLLSVCMAGVNLIHGVTSEMDGMMIASYEQCVIDDQIMGMVGRIVEGVEVNEETLAFDEIMKVKENRDSYLETEHTMRHYRDFWEPGIYPRKNFSEWQADGASELSVSAGETAERILEEHFPGLLSKQQLEELDRIAAG
jgi:trimethylamine---corrinoid protein Co-methyltransferase